MFLGSLYLLFAAIRSKVVLHGNRVTDTGVFRQKEFDLQEVTSAKWQSRGRIKKPRLVVAQGPGAGPDMGGGPQQPGGQNPNGGDDVVEGEFKDA